MNHLKRSAHSDAHGSNIGEKGESQKDERDNPPIQQSLRHFHASYHSDEDERDDSFTDYYTERPHLNDSGEDERDVSYGLPIFRQSGRLSHARYRNDEDERDNKVSRERRPVLVSRTDNSYTDLYMQLSQRPKPRSRYLDNSDEDESNVWYGSPMQQPGRRLHDDSNVVGDQRVDVLNRPAPLPVPLTPPIINSEPYHNPHDTI